MRAETIIKHILIEENIKMMDIATHVQNTSIQNLSQKLKRNTIKYQEMLDIADFLGYEIRWLKKEDTNE